MVSGTFEKFGVISHTVDTKIPDFVTYLEQGKVMATRCKRCHTLYFPPKVDCPKCVVSDMAWEEISGEGTLLTYSTVHYGPAGFEDKAPYTLGLARFGDIQVFAFLSKDITPGDMKVGMKVKIAAVKLPPDRVSFELRKA